MASKKARKRKQVIMLSIKPEYSSKIKSKTKTVELRKRIPKVMPDVILVYESAPTKCLSYAVRVTHVHSASVPELWKQVGSVSGITKKEFYAYFGERPKGFAYGLQKILDLPKQFSREDLLSQGIFPPQDYCFVPEAFADDLLD